MKQKQLLLAFASFVSLSLQAQTKLSLDSCRTLALQNNKQLSIAKVKKNVSKDVKKAIRTKYLPKIDVVAGYEFFNKEVSLLNDQQKGSLSHLGSNFSQNIASTMGSVLGTLAQQGVLNPQVATQLGAIAQKLGSPLANFGDKIGEELTRAFRTDTRNIWSGAVMVKQPIYLGGAIVAANKMASIGEDFAENNIEVTRQNVLYSTDQAYWLVVSLKQKQALAKSYLSLVKKLQEDVHKMIKEGVATRANGLKVDVKVNEAEMQLMQVENGVSLSRMLLCQLCGLSEEQKIVLADEDEDEINVLNNTETITKETAFSYRPEIKMLQNAIDLSRQNTKLVRATQRPQIALTGGYIISNPNMFNGFQNKFSGVWNVGVLVRVPIWNWFEGTYKIRASRNATIIATLDLEEAKEKINLQIAQCNYKLVEAQKRLVVAKQNIKSANENLRCANIGFKEGVMETTDVMAAQTAWQQAQSLKIDAEIELKLAQVNLKKALGTL